MRSASLVAIACAITATFATMAARGQSSDDKIAAEALFERGRALAADGKYAQACPLFADSERLDPSSGTLLNLANCYEKIGRTATAWATYREAAGVASASGRADHLAAATRHAEVLAPRLAKLTITVVRPVAGLQVLRDGVDVTAATWGVSIPVDTGSHFVQASAKDYKPWSATFDVPQDGAQVSIEIPPLEPTVAELPAAVGPTSSQPLAVAPAPAAADSPASPPGRSQRLAGLAIGGLGIIGLGVSGVLALVAKAKDSDSKQYCMVDNPNVCAATGFNERNDAVSDGNIATVALGIGAAALVGGAIVWLVAPGTPAGPFGRLGVSPNIGTVGAGASLRGEW